MTQEATPQSEPVLINSEDEFHKVMTDLFRSMGPTAFEKALNKVRSENSSDPPETTPSGSTDPVLLHMHRIGLQPTRQNYLEFIHPEGVPDPYPAELEGNLPAEITAQL